MNWHFSSHSVFQLFAIYQDVENPINFKLSISGAIQSDSSSLAALQKIHRHNERSNCTNSAPPSKNFGLVRGIRTDCVVKSTTKDNDNAPKVTNIDEFRANEERIEREYEERQRSQSKTEKDEQHERNTDETEKIESIRRQILDAALPFVKAYGWSREAITRGAESINYPSVAHGMFPNGSIELIHHFYAKCNREVIDQLQKELDEKRETGTIHVNPVEFSTHAIRLRLEKLLPYLDTWPQAMAMMTLPPNVPTSLAQLLTFVDDICYLAGDRSVDVSVRYEIIFWSSVWFIIFVNPLLFSADWMVYASRWHRIHLQDDRIVFAARQIARSEEYMGIFGTTHRGRRSHTGISQHVR